MTAASPCSFDHVGDLLEKKLAAVDDGPDLLVREGRPDGPFDGLEGQGLDLLDEPAGETPEEIRALPAPWS